MTRELRSILYRERCDGSSGSDGSRSFHDGRSTGPAGFVRRYRRAHRRRASCRRTTLRLRARERRNPHSGLHVRGSAALRPALIGHLPRCHSVEPGQGSVAVGHISDPSPRHGEYLGNHVVRLLVSHTTKAVDKDRGVVRKVEILKPLRLTRAHSNRPEPLHLLPVLCPDYVKARHAVRTNAWLQQPADRRGRSPDSPHTRAELLQHLAERIE